VHNWIGTVGAYLAWGSFLPFGVVGYLLPVLFAAFGVAYLLNVLGYLRERLRWSLLWTVVLLIALTGLFHMMDDGSKHGKFHEVIGSMSSGGWLGYLTFGQTPRHEYGFCLLGKVGAIIVYATLCLISLLFLTNFQLGEWIRRFLQKEPAAAEPKSADETALERRARDLEKQAKKLQEEVQHSGLGADLQPVPEPTVRDLSVSQAKPASARVRKPALPEPSKETEAVREAEPAPPREAVAATTEDILGKKPEVAEKNGAEKSDGEKPEPVVHIADGSAPAAPPKPRAPKKPKPLSVAATPIIGNYQLPPLDFLQHPDMTVKPTES
jgi:hypothetical protein